MPAPFRILGIDHVVLRAADPDALERFYVDVLGCTVEKRQPAIALTQLRAGRTLIRLRSETTGAGFAFRADMRLRLVLLVELVDLLVGVVVEDQRLSFSRAFQRTAFVLGLVALRGARGVGDPAGPGGGLQRGDESAQLVGRVGWAVHDADDAERPTSSVDSPGPGARPDKHPK